jgi:hypothetical protein
MQPMFEDAMNAGATAWMAASLRSRKAVANPGWVIE